VGPVWRGGGRNEDELLANCYRNSLALAVEHGVKSIAFPGISTGVYGFPVPRACRIALRNICDFLARDATLERVIAVCFSRGDYQEYLAAAREMEQKG
jgi:O-acetyl-ADP-ribose deacetylase (regulator of RNase III)